MPDKKTAPPDDPGGGGQGAPGRADQRWIEADPGRGQSGGSAVPTLGEETEVSTGRTAQVRGILVVDEVPRRNKKLVMAVRAVGDGSVGERVAVRVRENKNYMPGMEMVGAYEEGPGVWVQPGKGPRRRGVW
jgi:hypothetical protein